MSNSAQCLLFIWMAILVSDFAINQWRRGERFMSLIAWLGVFSFSLRGLIAWLESLAEIL